jgi:hypothetical protein
MPEITDRPVDRLRGCGLAGRRPYADRGDGGHDRCQSNTVALVSRIRSTFVRRIEWTQIYSLVLAVARYSLACSRWPVRRYNLPRPRWQTVIASGEALEPPFDSKRSHGLGTGCVRYAGTTAPGGTPWPCMIGLDEVSIKTATPIGSSRATWPGTAPFGWEVRTAQRCALNVNGLLHPSTPVPAFNVPPGSSLSPSELPFERRHGQAP